MRFFPAAALVLTLSLAACGRKADPVLNRAVLETPVGEAVLRQVLSECPAKEEAKIVTIVVGELQDAASEAFEQRFADTGLRVTPSKRLVAGAAGGKVRIFDGQTQEPPIILQLSSLDQSADVPPSWTAVAAWAWKEDAKRFSYKVTEKAGGGYEVTRQEEIPVPPRNQDFKYPEGAKPEGGS